MTSRDVQGTTYLLHLDPPYRHARHYLGFAEGDGLDARLASHGGPRGARLLAVAKAAGSTWRLVRTWPGSTRGTERQIKNTRHVPHYCPECQPQRSAARRAARSAANPRPQARKDTAMTTTDPDPIRTAGDKYDAAIRDIFAAIPRETCTRRTWKQARPAIAATRQELERELAAARAGFGDATRTVAAQYAAGVDLEAIAEHHDDVSASLLSGAQTSFGRAYAREYSDTAASLVADLRQDQAVARDQSAAACTQPDGTPHPDPVLAARGWQADHGIWQRTGSGHASPAAIADREAG